MIDLFYYDQKIKRLEIKNFNKLKPVWIDISKINDEESEFIWCILWYARK